MHQKQGMGDWAENLEKFSEQVDVFVHDTDHRADYERAEFLVDLEFASDNTGAGL